MTRSPARLFASAAALLLFSTAAVADQVDDFCTGMAGMASTTAEARDAGVGMDQLLPIVSVSCDTEDFAGIEAECKELMTNLLTVVYANTDLSPADLYRETYLICLEGFEE